MKDPRSLPLYCMQTDIENIAFHIAEDEIYLIKSLLGKNW